MNNPIVNSNIQTSYLHKCLYKLKWNILYDINCINKNIKNKVPIINKGNTKMKPKYVITISKSSIIFTPLYFH